jgi:hypothetical protein
MVNFLVILVEGPVQNFESEIRDETQLVNYPHLDGPDAKFALCTHLLLPSGRKRQWEERLDGEKDAMDGERR